MLGSIPQALAREGQALALAASAAVVLFAGLLLLVPPFAIGFDEAKYLGVGANIWAGQGPVSAFGGLFLLHSPLWMTVLYAPEALLGFDAVTWGHALNGLAGATVVGVAALMGRRISAPAGVIAAFAMLGFAYLFHLTRTTRLDVPAAAMALLFLEVGWRAIRSESARWGALAGLVFALAVLVKEVAIPLAPVPLICGVLAGTPWRRILRTTGWMALTATAGLAPWFLYYAAETGRVYRVESAAWTLPLLVAPVLVVIVVGLLAERLAGATPIGGRLEAMRHRLPAPIVACGRPLAGWGLALAWAAAFLYFFSRISRLKGASMFQVAQYKLYIGQWLVEMAPVAAFCAVGLVLALLLLATDRGARERRGVVNALVATICGAPLVLMVIAVGEPPRNYIAQVATAIAVGAGGWAWAIGCLLGRLTRGGRRPALARRGMSVVLALAMVAGTGAVGALAWVTRAGSGDAGTQLIRTTVDWVKANVPPGTPLAFGSYLSYEIAYQLLGDYPTHHIRHGAVIVNPAMPLGFERAGEPPSDDWVAADTAPRNINEYQAFRATWVEAALERWQIGYWIYATGLETAAPTILAQLTPEHGFETVATWTFGEGAKAKTVTILRVDPARAALDRSRLYISPEALARLVDKLAETPDASRAAAAALVERIVVVPASPGAAADVDRLRALAGP